MNYEPLADDLQRAAGDVLIAYTLARREQCASNLLQIADRLREREEETHVRKRRWGWRRVLAIITRRTGKTHA